MKHLSDEPQLLKQVLNLIASEFGSRCEVVLHDLEKDYSHTIVDIRNGHITNRDVGGCGSNLGLEVLSGNVIDGDRYNYVTTTSDGKILRSSSIYIKNDEGKVIGSLCVNLDITESIKLESFIKQYNKYDINDQQEFFATNVEDLLDHLIQQATELSNKKPTDLSKDERIEFLKLLEDKGAMRISKSGDRICEVLGISKFTLYNDLETIKNRKKQS